MIEVDFKDRVPSNPGRVTLTPVAGETNTFDQVRADNPTEEGTPLDKATFNSIIHSRLTGRYYKPNYTRVSVSSATSSSNPIPQSGWTNVTSTGAQSGSYIIAASGSRSNTFTPDKAFDASTTTSWQDSNDTTGEMWISVNFGSPIIITRNRVHWTSDDYEDFVIRLQGSNDGASWTDVASRTGTMTAPETWETPNTVAYSMYRLWFRQGTVNPMRLYEWSVTGWGTATYRNELVIPNGVPAQWTTGQRILIETPATVNTVAVTANTLNGVTVGTILQPSKRYELRYTGSSFAAKEV